MNAALRLGSRDQVRDSANRLGFSLSPFEEGWGEGLSENVPNFLIVLSNTQLSSQRFCSLICAQIRRVGANAAQNFSWEEPSLRPSPRPSPSGRGRKTKSLWLLL